MKYFIVIVAALSLISPAFGVTLDRCSLSRALDRFGVPRSEMPQWACIADLESSYRTHVIGPPNNDSSRDYGIFQINSRYWCQPTNGTFSSNGCSVQCNALLTDNIRNSINCARIVRAQQGWTAWRVWRSCNGYLPIINECFRNC